MDEVVQGVLRGVNFIREQHDLPHVDHLEKGTLGKCETCPIAQTISAGSDLYVEVDFHTIRVEDPVRDNEVFPYEPSPMMEKFILEFDAGGYEDYHDKVAEEQYERRINAMYEKGKKGT